MIDWLNSTQEQRKKLYKVLKHVGDQQNKTLGEMHHHVFGVDMALDYDATLRAGKFSKKKASQLFSWLETNAPEICAPAFQVM